MGTRLRWWRCAVAIVVATVVATDVARKDNPTPGMDLLHQFLNNDPGQLCNYIQCQEPLRASECPEGTTYQEKVTQMGCCGACVRYKQIGELNCTGSLDPRFRETTHDLLTSEEVDDDLDTQSFDNILNSYWCDYNLNCSADNESSSMCVPDNASVGCVYVQRRYDDDLNNGVIKQYRDDYRWRPECTLDGQYAEKQCKGPYTEKRCLCADPSGGTIYGKAFRWQTDLYDTMNCKCSRRVWEMTQAGASSVTLHCQENGNYEALQCEDGWCYCVIPDTGVPYGAFLPENAMELLPCYNGTMTGVMYLRRCESEHHAHARIVDRMHDKGVLQGPSSVLSCDPDGSYSAYQYDLDGLYRCYDKYNNVIEQPAGGGCNCARDQKLYQESHVITTLTCETLDEALAGVYLPIQSRGDTVFCVDQDGVRAGPIVYAPYRGYLHCDKGTDCQNGNYTACEQVCDPCPTSAYPAYTVNQ
ncbi:uncharacterized protein [Cherax quadricarinatus]